MLNEYLDSPLRERTQTQRSQPSELNSCSAALFSRSRSRAQRCSRSESPRFDVALAMTAPPEGPARGPLQPPKRTPQGCENQAAGPQRIWPTPEQSLQASASSRARHGDDDAATGPTKTDAPGPASDAVRVLAPTRHLGAPLLECTRSGQLLVEDRIAGTRL